MYSYPDQSGHQLIYTSDIQFIRFRVIFYIFLTELDLARPHWTGEEDRKDGAIVSEYNPTNKSDELKIDRK